jgi:hypothetical protein
VLITNCLDKFKDVRNQQVLSPLEQSRMGICVTEAKKVLKDMEKLLESCAKLKKPGSNLGSRFRMAVSKKDTLRRRFDRTSTYKARNYINVHSQVD